MNRYYRLNNKRKKNLRNNNKKRGLNEIEGERNSQNNYEQMNNNNGSSSHRYFNHNERPNLKKKNEEKSNTLFKCCIQVGQIEKYSDRESKRSNPVRNLILNEEEKEAKRMILTRRKIGKKIKRDEKNKRKLARKARLDQLFQERTGIKKMDDAFDLIEYLSKPEVQLTIAHLIRFFPGIRKELKKGVIDIKNFQSYHGNQAEESSSYSNHDNDNIQTYQGHHQIKNNSNNNNNNNRKNHPQVNSEQYKKDNEAANLMEVFARRGTLAFNGRVGKTPLKVLFSTGSRNDIITKETCKLLKNVQIKKDEEGIYLDVLTETKSSDKGLWINEYVELKVILNKFCIIGRFWVVDWKGMGYNIKIGNPTHFDYKIILNFGEKYSLCRETNKGIVKITNEIKTN